MSTRWPSRVSFLCPSLETPRGRCHTHMACPLLLYIKPSDSAHLGQDATIMSCSALRSQTMLWIVVLSLWSVFYKNVLVLSLFSCTWLKKMERDEKKIIDQLTVAKLVTYFSVCVCSPTSFAIVALKEPSHQLSHLRNPGSPP